MSKIVIVGTGGVGGYFGGKLAQAGHEVTFIARGLHAEKMKSEGLRVKSIAGDFHLTSISVAENIGTTGTSPDLILVCVKAWQVREVAPAIQGVLASHTKVLPLQNGVVAANELAEAIDEKHIIGGVCRILSEIESPGIIRHFGATPEIIVGELFGAPDKGSEAVADLFMKSGISSFVSQDIQSEIWKKFMFICVGGLMAVAKTTFGPLRDLPETRQMMISLITEIYNLAVAKGVKLEKDLPEKIVSFIDTLPPDSAPSLARDIWNGKPSEIDYQNGMVAKLAKHENTSAPVNQFVHWSLLPQEKQARKT